MRAIVPYVDGSHPDWAPDTAELDSWRIELGKVIRSTSTMEVLRYALSVVKYLKAVALLPDLADLFDRLDTTRLRRSTVCTAWAITGDVTSAEWIAFTGRLNIAATEGGDVIAAVQNPAQACQ